MKKRSVNKLKKELEKLKNRPPRAGVHPTKVFKDKTKYNRKDKYKNGETKLYGK